MRFLKRTAAHSLMRITCQESDAVPIIYQVWEISAIPGPSYLILILSALDELSVFFSSELSRLLFHTQAYKLHTRLLARYNVFGEGEAHGM